ncbi:MAG: hypothetical protein IKK33_06440 [Lachnospiraceae bacterium]|nr:hypothetical protein [Lachnospiraceae bacterium]
MNDIVIYVLLGLSVVSAVIAVVSLVLVLNVLKNQQEIIKICKAKPVENHASTAQVVSNGEKVAQVNRQETKKHGIIICKKCYAAISETSVACSVCKMPVGRR